MNRQKFLNKSTFFLFSIFLFASLIASFLANGFAALSWAQADAPHPPKGGWLNAPGKADAFAEAPDHPGLDQKIGNEFTIEAWVYLRRRPEANERWTIVSKPGSYSMEVFGRPDVPVRPVVRITAGGVTVSSFDIGIREWIHAAGVFKPNNGVGGFNAGFYKNGRLLGLLGPTMGKIADTESPIRVGENFDGAIDQIRISKVARYTVPEINPFKPPAELFKPDEDTVALWQFEDGENAKQFRDDSGDGNHLIPQGGIQISEKPLENEFDVFEPQAKAWFQETKLKVLATSLGKSEIFLFDGAELSVRNLTNTPKKVERYSAWSPDGKQIAFSTFKALGQLGDENWDLYVMDVESGNLTQMTDHRSWEFPSDWSPDGKKIAFDGKMDNQEKLDVYVIDVASKQVERLTDESGYDAKWSPNGRRIAFVSHRSGNAELYIMDSDGKRERQLTNHKAEVIWGHSWSPDSKKLVYAYRKDNRAETLLMIADLATNQVAPFEIEKPPALRWWYPSTLFWLPDGKYIVVHNVGIGVYRVDVDGKNLTLILQLPSDFNFWIDAWFDPAHPPGASQPVEPIGKQHTTFGRIKQTALLQNFPNPFNPETWIPYQLGEAASVSISIYDARGGLIRRLDIRTQAAGSYLTKEKAAYWDGRNQIGELVASGVYFYRLDAGDFTATKKMILVK